MDAYLASDPTFENVWDPIESRPTEFGREFTQLIQAGYTWEGSYLSAPGG